MLDAVKAVADYFWTGRLQELCGYAADATKFDQRILTPEEVKQLEAAKHYIEIALRNSEYNKEQAA